MEQYLSRASEWASTALYILEFLIGLSVVVFVHELGHFLVAKWVGIKVEQFAIGMGKRVFGVKIGETDYRVNLFPLGGYVKMLGQEDFGPLKETDKPDPRSFEQKSVGARFAVISAGVVMNVILAGVLFMIVGMVGKPFQAAVIGAVTPGLPAGDATVTWEGASSQPATAPESAAAEPASAASATAATETAATTTAPATTEATTATAPAGAGIAWTPAKPSDPWDPHFKPGDKIVEIQGNSIISWINDGKITQMFDVIMTSALSAPSDVYTFKIERTVNGVTRAGTASVGVKPAGDLMVFGIVPALSPVIGKQSRAEQRLTDLAPFQSGDRIVSVAGKPTPNLWDITHVDESLDGKPVQVGVDRGGQTIMLTVQPILEHREGFLFRPDGSSFRGVVIKNEDESFQVRLPTGKVETFKDDQLDSEPVNILGMIPRIRIDMIDDGSPADKAGLKPGDIVLAYGDKQLPTNKQLLDINKDRVDKETQIDILRGQERISSIKITPKTKSGAPLLGIVLPARDLEHPVVTGLAKGTPAAKAGIERGATITAINAQAVKSWTDIYNVLRSQVGKDVTITYTIRNITKQAKLGLLTATMFDPEAYEFAVLRPTLPLEPLQVTIRTDGPLNTILWGTKETAKQVLGTYVTIRSLVMGYVPLNKTAGPLGIGTMAVKMAQQGFIDFIYFFAIISAAIAVFNFLPLPVMDGGFAVFLLIEKIRGRPVPTRVMNIVQYAGIALLLCLFVAVTWNDIARITSGMW